MSLISVNRQFSDDKHKVAGISVKFINFEMAPIGYSKASGKLIRQKSHVRLPCKRNVQHAGDFHWLCKACTCYVHIKKTEQNLIIYETEVEFNSILTPLIIK